MSRAQDLFDRLERDGASALDELMAEREPESLFLDFKGSPNGGASPLLASDDNRNLSKGISGFANSAGGVLIWGVDCRRDASGQEVASKRPLVDAQAFRTKIEGAISRTTLPPHSGVRTLAIEDRSSVPSGYCAVLVPQSAVGPIRSVATNHYHLRSGSDFGIVPHDVLAGMFGRSPQPEIHPNFIDGPIRINTRAGYLTMSVGIAVVNFGAVIADRPYLSIRARSYHGEPLALVDVRTSDYRISGYPLPVISLVANANLAIAPGASDFLGHLLIEMPLGDLRDVDLACSVGAVGTPPRHFSLRSSGAALKAALAAGALAGQQTTSVLHVNHD
jgi:hypothetical protein